MRSSGGTNFQILHGERDERIDERREGGNIRCKENRRIKGWRILLYYRSRNYFIGRNSPSFLSWEFIRAIFAGACLLIIFFN